MASNVYTLPELVDLALRTPEIGAVNFNILRIILHKIIVECKLQTVTGEWKPIPLSSAAYLIPEEKLPDHPLTKRITEEKERTATKSTEPIEEKPTDESAEEVPFDNKDVHKIKESQTYKTDDISKTSETNIIKKEEVSNEPYVERKTEEKEKEKHVIEAISKTQDHESNWFNFWKLKKLVKRIEAVEEELNSIVETVDDLRSWKDAKTKRFQELEVELESGYFGPTIGREEFEDTVEELGEMLTLLRSKQKEQKEKFDAVNQDIVKEMQLMATQEEMKQSKNELNKKFNTLSKAIATMQEVIKEAIYPETCATSKCLFCKRKAHLPVSGMAIDVKKDVAKDPNISGVAVDKKKTGGDFIKRTIKKVNGKGGNKSPQELTFTTACLKRLIGEGGMRTIFDEIPPEDLQPGENSMHTEEPVITKHLLTLEAFEVPNLTSDFAPLRSFPDTKRRECIYIPSIRSKRDPLGIPVASIKT